MAGRYSRPRPVGELGFAPHGLRAVKELLGDSLVARCLILREISLSHPMYTQCTPSQEHASQASIRPPSSRQAWIPNPQVPGSSPGAPAILTLPFRDAMLSADGAWHHSGAKGATMSRSRSHASMATAGSSATTTPRASGAGAPAPPRREAILELRWLKADAERAGARPAHATWGANSHDASARLGLRLQKVKPSRRTHEYSPRVKVCV